MAFSSSFICAGYCIEITPQSRLLLGETARFCPYFHFKCMCFLLLHPKPFHLPNYVMRLQKKTLSLKYIDVCSVVGQGGGFDPTLPSGGHPDPQRCVGASDQSGEEVAGGSDRDSGDTLNQIYVEGERGRGAMCQRGRGNFYYISRCLQLCLRCALCGLFVTPFST